MKKKKTKLVFNVGPATYTARIAPGPIMADGSPAGVAWIEAERGILLEGCCPPKQRLSRIAWAVMRAWVNQTGEPRTMLDWCDLCGTAVEQMLRDLNKQGGIHAVNHLRPSKPIKTSTAQLGPSTVVNEEPPFRRRIS
jgi:hypothetical protein